MATSQLNGAPERADHPASEPMSEADRIAHELASYVRPPRDDSPARPLTSFARRDVRTTVARVRGW